MPLFSTIWSADRSSLHRDRSADVSRSLRTERGAAEPSLPRHLLVSLAGITADIASLQQRSADEPQLHEALGAILGRLDGLVDSIYERTADPAPPGLPRAGLAEDPPPDALSAVPGEFGDAESTSSPAQLERSLPSHPSWAAIVDHGRRQPWVSASESEHSS